jgi:hypothetical protein
MNHDRLITFSLPRPWPNSYSAFLRPPECSCVAIVADICHYALRGWNGLGRLFPPGGLVSTRSRRRQPRQTCQRHARRSREYWLYSVSFASLSLAQTTGLVRGTTLVRPRLPPLLFAMSLSYAAGSHSRLGSARSRLPLVAGWYHRSFIFDKWQYSG